MSETLEWVLGILAVALFLGGFWFPFTHWAFEDKWVWRWWRQ